MAQFYRELFQARRNKVSMIVKSSRGIVLEAGDQRGNTLARISIRGSFDTASAFLAWAQDFDRPPH